MTAMIIAVAQTSTTLMSAVALAMRVVATLWFGSGFQPCFISKSCRCFRSAVHLVVSACHRRLHGLGLRSCWLVFSISFGPPGGIRTRSLVGRNHPLWSVELPGVFGFVKRLSHPFVGDFHVGVNFVWCTPLRGPRWRAVGGQVNLRFDGGRRAAWALLARGLGALVTSRCSSADGLGGTWRYLRIRVKSPLGAASRSVLL